MCTIKQTFKKNVLHIVLCKVKNKFAGIHSKGRVVELVSSVCYLLAG